jgi:hypothetical protein
MLLIGLLLSQLSRVASSSAETITVGVADIESVGLMRTCAFDPLDVLVMDASGAVDGLDEHAASASAAAPTIVPVIDLVMFFMVSSIFLIGLILKGILHNTS